MILYFRTIIICTLLSTWLWSAPSIAQDKLTDSRRIVVANAGFATPESIEYYAAEDVYLVSNINGDALEAAGNGFISKVKPDGRVIHLKWIDGNKKGIVLNAPKGLAIQGNNLYITDINQIQVFDLSSGKQKNSINIRGSNFLNGITPGSGPFVYVTDSGLKAGKDGFVPANNDAIYKVWADGKYELVIKDKNMGYPNGIVVDGNELVVVTFGSGEAFRINAAGKRHTLPTPPKGGLDGLLLLEDGRLLMSSWGGAALYILNKDNSYSILADSLDSPADLGFDTKRKRVLIPLFKQDKLVFLSLGNKGSAAIRGQY